MGTGRKNRENGQILGQAIGWGEGRETTFFVLQNNLTISEKHILPPSSRFSRRNVFYFETETKCILLVCLNNFIPIAMSYEALFLPWLAG